MSQHEYAFATEYMAKLGVQCPPPAELHRGGIIGIAMVYDVIWPRGRVQIDYACQAIPWFMGPIGLKLAEAATTDFIAAKGALGWFKWKASALNAPDATKPWMVRGQKHITRHSASLPLFEGAK
jgi:hypothetical protein